jgi:ribosomal protein L40E
MAGGPYRDDRPVARYVCIVCFRSLGTRAGVCPRCGVERLDLSDPEVRRQVRGEAEKRLERRLYREYAGAGVAATLLVAPVTYWLGFISYALVPPLAALLGRGWAMTRRNSAMAVYASRRRRISAELGVDVQIGDRAESSDDGPGSALIRDEALAAHADLDPQTLEVEPLLAWLGAKIDE